MVFQKVVHPLQLQLPAITRSPLPAVFECRADGSAAMATPTITLA